MDQGKGTLEMVDKPTTGMSQFRLQEKTYEDDSSEEEPEEKEARKGIQIQEVTNFCQRGVISPDLDKRLETFTAKAPEPQHILQKNC